MNIFQCIYFASLTDVKFVTLYAPVADRLSIQCTAATYSLLLIHHVKDHRRSCQQTSSEFYISYNDNTGYSFPVLYIYENMRYTENN